MDWIEIDGVSVFFFNRLVSALVSSCFLITQPKYKKGVALLLIFESTSNPMQVPTSQQKEGIYDVPKRHFMTVGVFIFYYLFLYYSTCKPLFKILLKEVLQAPLDSVHF